jgi:hypothetical protein
MRYGRSVIEKKSILERKIRKYKRQMTHENKRFMTQVAKPKDPTRSAHIGGKATPLYYVATKPRDPEIRSIFGKTLPLHKPTLVEFTWFSSHSVGIPRRGFGQRDLYSLILVDRRFVLVYSVYSLR